MVYNDFELVSTKRVGNSRRNGMILFKRQYAAAGGNSTLFTMGMCGLIGHAFKLQGGNYL